MRRKELMGSCKKVFSAIVAAAMVVTSVAPESLVFAADDFSSVSSQEFGDGSVENAETAADASVEETVPDDNVAAEQQEAEEWSSGEEEAEPFSDGEETVAAMSSESNTEEEKAYAFEQSQTVDGVKISVKAEEGVFPEGASLEVSEITDAKQTDQIEDAVKDTIIDEVAQDLTGDQTIDLSEMEPDIAKMYSFDIKILDSDGKEIQPDTSKGTVNVDFEGVDVSDNGGETAPVDIYHLDDELEGSELMDADVAASAQLADISVEAEHFSVYTVTVGNSLTAGSTLEGNTIYRVTDNTNITSTKAGESGLNVAGDASTVLWIKEDATLTVKGGNGSGRTGGGAGIKIPSNSTLTVTGAGTLNATGGNAGNPGNGGASGASTIAVEGASGSKINSHKTKWVDYTGGTGGTGGNGAGGAGAGIGGAGGTGGAGGAGGSGAYRTYKADGNGSGSWDSWSAQWHGAYSGSSGGSGTSGGTMGAFNVLGTVKVNANGGNASTATGYSGALPDKNNCSHGFTYDDHDSRNYNNNFRCALRFDRRKAGYVTGIAGPGGSGGGGGKASAAPGIGNGSGGAGGGAGAGGGGVWVTSDEIYPSSLYGYDLSAGKSGTGGYGSAGNGGTASNYGTTVRYWGDIADTRGASGGSGGSAASAGSECEFTAGSGTTVTVKKGTGSSTSTSGEETGEYPSVATVTISLDANGGETVQNTVNAVYGVDSSVNGGGKVSIPTRSGYIFDGYYDTKEDSGIQYYDKNGVATAVLNPSYLSEDITLYAHWSRKSEIDLPEAFVKFRNDGTAIEKVYTGELQYSGETGHNLEYKVTEKGGTDVGEYTVTYSLDNSDGAPLKWADGTTEDKTVTFKIIPAQIEGLTESPYIGTYDGADHSASVSATTPDVKISYCEEGKENYSNDPVSFKAAGTYTVHYRIEKANYNTIEGELSVTILPREITVTPDNLHKVYGEKDPELTWKVTSGELVKNEALENIETSREKGEDVNDYMITVQQKDQSNPNYAITFDKGTFTIEKREIGLEWGSEKLTYNGKEQTPEVTATNLVVKDTCNVILEGAQKDANVVTGVDNYTATAVKVDNRNYKLPAENLTKDFTIAQRVVEIDWTNTDPSYSGRVQLPVATVKNLAENDDCNLTVETFKEDQKVDAKNVGSYTARCTNVSNKNYKLPEQTDTESKFTIQEKKLSAKTVKATLSGTGLQYDSETGTYYYVWDGKDKEPSIKVTDSETGSEVTLERKTDFTVSGTTSNDEISSNKITLTAKGNYTGKINLTWNIVKASRTLQVIMADWTYGDKANSPVVSGEADEKDVVYTYYKDNDCKEKTTKSDGAEKTGAKPANAGTYYVKAEVAETAHHEAANAIATFNILKKTVTVQADANLSKVYGEKDPELTYQVTLVEGDTLSGSLSRKAGENVGEYAITVGTLENPNYEIKVDSSSKFTITQKKLTADMITVSPVNNSYTGDEIEPNLVYHDKTASIEGTGLTENDLTRGGATSSSDYGVYTLILKGQGNYTGKVEKIWCISPVVDTTVEYDGKDHSINNPSTSDVTVKFADENGNYTLDQTKGVSEPGIYEFKYLMTVDGEEYEGVTVLTITKVAVSTDPDNIELDTAVKYGTEIKPSLKGYDGEGKITYYYKKKGDSDDAYTTESPKEVGDYVLKMVVEETDTWAGAEIEKEFSVVKGTLEQKNPEAVYYGKPDTGVKTVALDEMYKNLDGVSFKIGAYTDEKGAVSNGSVSVSKDGVLSYTLTGNCTDDTTVTIPVIISSKNYEDVTVNVVINIDATAPTGQIQIDNNKWNSFLNNITFGFFFKNTKTVTITAKDAGCGVQTIQYYVSDKVLTEKEAAEAVATNGKVYEAPFDIQPTADCVVYVSISDTLGNTAVISSDGMVFYTDAEQNTKEITYTRKSGQDAKAEVTLNGNTVKEIKNGTVVLKKDKDYTLSKDGSSITFKADYLQTLDASETPYKLTVSYNPAGKEYKDAEGNEAPAETEISLTVQKAAGSISEISDASKTYDGKAVSAPDITTTNDKGADNSNVTYRYKVKDAEDSTYTTETPVNAGTYVVEVTVKADADYTEATATAEFTIKKAVPTVTDLAAQKLIYNGAAQELVTAGKTSDGTILYRLENTDWTENVPTGLNAGTYEVFYKVTGDANHTDLDEQKIEVSIARKEVTVTADSAKKHIGKADPKFTYVTEGLADKDVSAGLSGITFTRKDGETPGQYDITVAADAKANPNYEVKCNNGTAKLTIEDHIWTGEGEILKEATATSEGIKVFTCAYKDGEDTCAQKKYVTIPATGTTDPASDVMEKGAEITEDSPIKEGSLGNKESELLNNSKIVTEEEKAKIDKDHKVRVWLEISRVSDSVLTDDVKAAIQKEAEKLSGKDTKYVCFNTELFKCVDGGQRESISDPGMNIKVTIKIPDELLNTQAYVSREFKLFRINGTDLEPVKGTFNSSTKEFTFETDKLSAFAVTYEDTYYSPSYPVTGVTVSTDKVTLTKKGDTAQITATVQPSYADNKNVTWKSSDESVATVDKNGKVTAVGNGTATITVSTVNGNYTATVTVTVKIQDDVKPDPKPEIDKITVSSDNKTLTKIGDSTQINVKIEPENAESQKLIWKSSNEKVAVVDENGKVTAVGTGTATITVTTKDGTHSATITITVKVPDEPTPDKTTGFGHLKARSVKQTNNSITLDWTKVSDADGYLVYGNLCNSKGKIYKYKRLATITNNKTVTWTHKKLKKGTYYKYIVKAYKVVNGKKVIVDTSVSIHAITKGGKYGVAKSVSITSIGSKKKTTKATLKKGKTAQITAKEVKMDKAIKHHRNLCYESSNKKVATVTPDGVIKAVGKGTCNIWVYAQNGVYQTLTITVK